MAGGDELDELLPGGELLEERAAHCACHNSGLVCTRAARGHAHMKAFDIGSRSVTFEFFMEDSRELVGQILLQHGGSRHELGQSGKFGDAEYLACWDVCYRNSV